MNDTIAAIATAPGVGAVGVVRLSGANALTIARKIASGLPREPLSHSLTLHTLRDSVSQPIDTALVAYMKGPRSFTGEDVVEFQCHGGAVILSRLLDVVTDFGARLAEPGEFTRRAFLNGKLDLVQAEAVADLIGARSMAAARLAQRHLEGRLSRHITRMSEALAVALTRVEAAIDFSLEEHVFSLDRAELESDLLTLDGDLNALLATYDTGRVQREGLRCVIAGRPNAGKSTLLNRIIESERAIVSKIPGTTRDFLDVDFVLGGQLVTLIDTAGLRASIDPVEMEGVRRSEALVSGADFVVLVVDRAAGWSDEDARVIENANCPGLVLWNKSDIAAHGARPRLSSDWDGPVDVSLLEAGSSGTVQAILLSSFQD